MIMPEGSKIEEDSNELERVTYGKTRISLLSIDGRYQVRKIDKQGVISDIVNYDELGNLFGDYNAEIEDAFERIKLARRHIDQFAKEKDNLFLRVESTLDSVELNNEKKPDYSGELITSVSEKPMVVHIFPSKELRSHLDFLTIDETI